MKIKRSEEIIAAPRISSQRVLSIHLLLSLAEKTHLSRSSREQASSVLEKQTLVFRLTSAVVA